MAISRNIFWIAFFASILASWWWLYSMSLSMNMDLLGRMSMNTAMSNMDMSKELMSTTDKSKKMTFMDTMKGHMAMDNSMTRFLPLAGMWAIMMAAMMLPTMVPTLRSYEDLMTSANGTRVGWLGVLLGYSIVWVLFSLAVLVVDDFNAPLVAQKINAGVLILPCGVVNIPFLALVFFD